MSAWRRANKPHDWRPRRGDVCLARVDKERPVVVISTNILNSFSRDVCILPVSTAEHREFSVRPKLAAGEGGLGRESWVKCDQPTTIRQTELIYPPLGTVSGASMRLLEERVKMALDLR